MTYAWGVKMMSPPTARRATRRDLHSVRAIFRRERRGTQAIQTAAVRVSEVRVLARLAAVRHVAQRACVLIQRDDLCDGSLT